MNNNYEKLRRNLQNLEIILEDLEKIKISTNGESPDKFKYHAIFIHGFKGFKDWGFIPYFSEFCAKNDIYLITFNFSLNGIGEDPLELSEMDKFAKNTFTREVFELNKIIESFENGFFGKTNNSKLTLIGHSRGGAIASICANNKTVDKLVLWATIAKLDRYTDRQKAYWKKVGFIEIENTRTHQIMRLNSTLLDDIEDNKDGSLSLEKALKILTKPILIAHGTNDLTVPIEEGEQLFNWTNKQYSKFVKIDKAAHTFDVQHPFTTSNEKFNKLLEETYCFITQ